MSISYENYMPTVLSNEVPLRIEQTLSERQTNVPAYVRNRFHPYAGGNISRQRNTYDSYYENAYYPEMYRNNFPMASEQLNYLSGSLYNTFGGSFLPLSQQCHRKGQWTNNRNQQINYQRTYIPEGIQNNCQPNAHAETSLQITSSAAGKDQRHPFFTRKRVEPALGMTRTRDKYRVVYTEKQRRGLEEEYNKNKFITTEIKTNISKELGLSARQIKIWFQNRRAKERRDSRKVKCSEQTGNIITDEDDDIHKHSLSSLDDTNQFSTSCRFTGSENECKERLFNFEQCRYSNQIETNAISSNSTTFSNSCPFESMTCQNVEPSTSPSQWNMSTGNSLIPTINVSPLSGIVNFDKELRL